MLRWQIGNGADLLLAGSVLYRLHEEDSGVFGTRPPDGLHHRQRPLRDVVADDERALLDVEALLCDGRGEQGVQAAVAKVRDDGALVGLARDRVLGLEVACSAASLQHVVGDNPSEPVAIVCVCLYLRLKQHAVPGRWRISASRNMHGHGHVIPHCMRVHVLVRPRCERPATAGVKHQ